MRIALARSLAAILCMSAVLSTMPAAAQTPTEKAAARALANEGEAALKKQDYATAFEKYDKASRLIPDALTLTLGLARAQLGLGKLVEAKESFNVVMRTPLGPNAPAAYKAAKAEAEKEIVGIEPRIGAVFITVEPASAVVTVDGDVVPSVLIGDRRPTNPGTHVVRGTAPGYRPAETKIEVKAGSRSDAKLVLAKDAPPPPPPVVEPPPPEPPPPAPPPSSNGLRTGAWVAAGVSVAGLAVGGVFGLLAKSKHDDLTTACGGGTKCPPSAKAEHDAFESRGTISTIGFIAGGVGAAVAIPLFVLSKPASNASTAASARFVVAPSSFAVSGSF